MLTWNNSDGASMEPQQEIKKAGIHGQGTVPGMQKVRDKESEDGNDNSAKYQEEDDGEKQLSTLQITEPFRPQFPLMCVPLASHISHCVWSCQNAD